MKKCIARTYELTDKGFDYIAPLFILLVRLYLAQVFFMAGLTKIANWESTIFLFENEYSVPLLSPAIAAYLGTIAELVLPVLIVLGIGSRWVILVFFIYNLVAMFSYSFLWTPDGSVGLTDHIQWGLLILMLLCTGFGKFSLDYLIRRFYLKMDKSE
ncbi:DoxX family protein [Legionella israelensis]|uniref:Putative transmembrane protein n=1 Tax=Legionella israelensis TaxID=454 RepID=A0A0W0VUL5_9GAMM|nr:DoxX family protein [Legionella israelensis]KTD23661.1 putative transmembrane protein [Legionella israelensis]QBS10955.1 DoxX family protein [Legionella israelensis]SCX79330.1 putative oxidoreductase [Legionella israelensis DSM 19235]STX57947.1 putative transmembrane protein [Legionella israelensis]